jgi:acid phosphatase family membrane protein YuiD
MDGVYLITPFFAWLCAGSLKFMINSIRSKSWATGQIGYGGMPSNHSTIVSSMVFLVLFKEGLDSAAFGVAVTLAFITMLDANSLRRQIGKQAEVINQLVDNKSQPLLRERMGHTRWEILAGVILGACVAWIINLLSV